MHETAFFNAHRVISEIHVKIHQASDIIAISGNGGHGEDIDG
jgi:hypothetical protein